MFQRFTVLSMALKQTFLVLINLFQQLVVPLLRLNANPLLKVLDVVLDISTAFARVFHKILCENKVKV